jgi:hypothetical protein
VHATDEPLESVSDRLVAVKKVDSAIQLWSKMQIADADRLSKIKSNVEFQKYSSLHTRPHPSLALALALAPHKLKDTRPQHHRHLPCNQVASPALCQTLTVAHADRSLCSDITASLMQHLMMVMRTQGQLEQEIQWSREETTNARLEGELKHRSNEVHVEQKLPDENHRQLRQQQEEGQNADTRWRQTAQDELLLQLHTAEVAGTKECRASSAFYPLPFALCLVLKCLPGDASPCSAPRLALPAEVVC